MKKARTEWWVIDSRQSHSVWWHSLSIENAKKKRKILEKQMPWKLFRIVKVTWLQEKR